MPIERNPDQPASAATGDEGELSLIDLARLLFGPKHGIDLPEHPPVTLRPPLDFDSADFD